MNSSPKVALIYDRVTTRFGGAELVLQQLHQLYPDAPLFTAVYNQDQTPWADEIDVIPSWLQKIPGAQHKHRWLAPFTPLAFESFELSEYDIVISITSAEAKGVITLPHQLHICYLLTPTRYLYSHTREYLANHPPFSWPGIRQMAHLPLNYLRWWDQAAAARPDFLIPISQVVGDRTQKYYHRQPTAPLYPPVPTPETVSTNQTRAGFVVISRLVPYKRIDLAILAAQQLGTSLTVVGTGPDEVSLKKLARNYRYIEFKKHISEDEKAILLARSEALIMPGIEDFGITALEASAHGTPVIVHHQSGAAELLTTKQAVLINKESVDQVSHAIKQVQSQAWNYDSIAKNMKKYDTNIFRERFSATVTRLWHQHLTRHQ